MSEITQKRLYVAARFAGFGDRGDGGLDLSSAIASAGFIEFNFVRDVKQKFSSQSELWSMAKNEIEKSDAFLIDVSDQPSGGRLVEIGIAYSMQKPIIIVVKNGIDFKDFYRGVAAFITQYDECDEIIDDLKLLYEKC